MTKSKVFTHRFIKLSTRKSRLSRTSRKQSGSVMIEFALTLPITMIFLAGILDFGWVVHQKLVIQEAMRAGVRAATNLDETFFRRSGIAGALQCRMIPKIAAEFAKNYLEDNRPFETGVSVKDDGEDFIIVNIDNIPSMIVSTQSADFPPKKEYNLDKEDDDDSVFAQTPFATNQCFVEIRTQAQLRCFFCWFMKPEVNDKFTMRLTNAPCVFSGNNCVNRS